MGYGTEVAKEVLRFLFEDCEADLVYSEYMEKNIGSGRVMRKIGLKYEGVLKSRVIDKNGNRNRNDLISYSMTREEYFNERSK